MLFSVDDLAEDCTLQLHPLMTLAEVASDEYLKLAATGKASVKQPDDLTCQSDGDDEEESDDEEEELNIGINFLTPDEVDWLRDLLKRPNTPTLDLLAKSLLKHLDDDSQSPALPVAVSEDSAVRGQYDCQDREEAHDD